MCAKTPAKSNWEGRFSKKSELEFENGAGSDRAATVRETFPASPIWRLEERVGTGAFEACLQGQHWGPDKCSELVPAGTAHLNSLN